MRFGGDLMKMSEPLALGRAALRRREYAAHHQVARSHIGPRRSQVGLNQVLSWTTYGVGDNGGPGTCNPPAGTFCPVHTHPGVRAWLLFEFASWRGGQQREAYVAFCHTLTTCRQSSPEGTTLDAGRSSGIRRHKSARRASHC